MNTLYFVTGPATKEQIALAAKVGAKLRNAAAYHEGDFIEKSDNVMGDIPKGYAKVDKHEAHAEAVKLTKPAKPAKKAE